MFKRIRKRLGLSQVKFAKLLDLPRATYQSYELNRRKPSKAKEREIRKKIKEIQKSLNKLENKLDNKDDMCLKLLIDIIIATLFMLYLLCC